MKTLLLGCFICLFGCGTKKDVKQTSTNTDSFNTKISNQDSVIVTKLPTIPEKIDFTNSQNLIIKMLPNRYQIYFHQDSLTTNDIKEIDKFIAQHIKTLNKDKTLLIGEPDGSLKNFKDLKAVLKKYEIYRFKIKTWEEVY